MKKYYRIDIIFDGYEQQVEQQIKRDKDVVMNYIKEGHKLSVGNVPNIELKEVSHYQYYELSIIIKCNKELDILSKLELNGEIVRILEGDTQFIKNVNINEVVNIKNKYHLMKDK